MVNLGVPGPRRVRDVLSPNQMDDFSDGHESTGQRFDVSSASVPGLSWPVGSFGIITSVLNSGATGIGTPRRIQLKAERLIWPIMPHGF